jgi:hypothetical protein
MDKVELREPVNAILVQHLAFDSNKNFYLKAGSALFSGLTGQRLGFVKGNIKLPCSKSVFLRNIYNERLVKVGPMVKEQGEGLNFEYGGIEFAPLKDFLKPKNEEWQTQSNRWWSKLKLSYKAMPLIILTRAYARLTALVKNLQDKFR